ncbi:terpenoid synthase [Gautieria morchelliformis]|nr:terpenoid synthase [Gautieria morchelliformis]
MVRLPDLISHCPFKPVSHKNGDAVAAASEKWFEDGCRVFSADMRRHIAELKNGKLAAYCYNECDDQRFRVICDYLIASWLIDDLSDAMTTKDTEILADLVMNAMTFPEFYRPTHTGGKEQPDEEPDLSRLMRDFCTRFISNAGSGCQTRFASSLELYLVAADRQAKERSSQENLSLENYVRSRRLSSACKPCFDLIEYSQDIDLPDDVIENPILEAMKDCANDYISWSNDIYSYNVEQSRGDTHNIITVIMRNRDLDVQGAFDHAGNMCIEAIKGYCEYKSRLPSYGPEIDRQVAAYTRGLESWISGNLEWSFLTQRYFGDRGQEIKKHLRMSLLPNQLPADTGRMYMPPTVA